MHCLTTPPSSSLLPRLPALTKRSHPHRFPARTLAFSRSFILERIQMAKATKRMEIIQHDLNKLAKEQAVWEAKRRGAAADGGGVERSDDDNDSDSDDDDEFEARREALEVELRDLQTKNAARQARLDEYEKNKKWNVDNMFEVKEERTFISPTAGTTTYTNTGYVKPKEQLEAETAAKPAAGGSSGDAGSSKPAGTAPAAAPPAQTPVAATSQAAAISSASSSPSVDDSGRQLQSLTVSPAPPPVVLGAMETYQQFTDKYADTVELFMAIPDLEGSKNFLLRYGDILLQENASNYLLLASLEDEMNGYRDKMHRTARQSQIVTSIAELAKTLKTHPGNVIEPFFARLQQREHLEEFLRSVKDFQDKIVKRAITKRQEMDAARAIHTQEAEDDGPQDLSSVPREERLGPGGLDPLEVIETLPEEMVAAFESRDVDNLRAALEKLTPEEAEYHMKRCVDSGLWVANAQG